ncbi:MAG: response regulator [Candidatus Binatia bacterium]|jgi:two-component system, NtrC family, response regulator AtoC
MYAMTSAKVLIIDDEHMIRWSVAQTLRAAGYEVALAETAVEGLALFREFQPAVVFLDVRLPDGNGLAMLQSVKNDRGRDAAVVVMTAYEDVCSAAEARRRGAFAYLKKPFDFDELPLIVAEAVGGRQSNKQRCD